MYLMAKKNERIRIHLYYIEYWTVDLRDVGGRRTLRFGADCDHRLAVGAGGRLRLRQEKNCIRAQNGRGRRRGGVQHTAEEREDGRPMGMDKAPSVPTEKALAPVDEPERPMGDGSKHKTQPSEASVSDELSPARTCRCRRVSLTR
jgi:hypothetical protein